MRSVIQFGKIFLFSACLTAIALIAQSTWAEDARPENAKNESVKKDDVKKDEAKKDEAKKDDAKKEDAGKDTVKKEDPAAPPRQVVACYFHRTNRCPTCKKISSYIEDSIKEAYKKELKDRKVAVTMIDFQDAKNKKFVDAYKITGPTLILMDIREGKVTAWKPAPKVWSLVTKKDSFYKYVQDEVRGYLESK